MNKYSVLISLYKKEKPIYLSLALDSMLNQTLPPDQIVIVKDGILTSELEMVLKEYQEKFPALFQIVGYEQNKGLGLALNFGLEYCRNDLVARMDSDDISKTERCQKQVEAFNKDPELVIIGSSIEEFVGTPKNIISRRVVPTTSEEIYNFAKRRSAFNHPSVMYKKSKVLEFGGYSNLRRNQDVDLFGRMLYGGCKAKNFAESLLWFRSDDDLAKRRRSWENTWSYIATINRFRKMGYSSFSDLAIVFGAQTLMFVCPISLQMWLYRKFLRI